jgi:hypothetical protein
MAAEFRIMKFYFCVVHKHTYGVGLKHFKLIISNKFTLLTIKFVRNHSKYFKDLHKLCKNTEQLLIYNPY